METGSEIFPIRVEQNEAGTRAGISDAATPKGEGLEQEAGREGASYH